MLFFDQYLASKGFEGQYTLVYGSVIGAGERLEADMGAAPCWQQQPVIETAPAVTTFSLVQAYSCS